MEDATQKNKKSAMLLAWKKAYLESIIDALKPTGSVLEVGYNLFASTHIQTYKPKNHTIIESDPKRVLEAQSFIESHPHVTLIQDSWSNALKKLTTFDTIFFNDSFQEDEKEALKFCSPEDVKGFSKEAKALYDDMVDQFNRITVKFSDQQVEELFKAQGQFHTETWTNFLENLKKNGNITNDQYDSYKIKYKLNKNNGKTKDDLLAFLQECLEKHMKKGSRFSAYLNENKSKYDDAQFFDAVITNPFVDYKEETVTINIPEQNMQFPQAIILLVEKNS